MRTLLDQLNALVNARGDEQLSTRQRRDGVRKVRPVSGRVGQDVVIELSRPELNTLAGVIDDLMAAWPLDDIPLPPVLAGMSRFLRRKVIRRGGDCVSVRMSKRAAYDIGRMLLSTIQHMEGKFPAQSGRWFIHGAMKLLLAGTSRPGKRTTKKVDVDPITEWRRRKSAETRMASSILLGK